jgi:hypothetical protein
VAENFEIGSAPLAVMFRRLQYATGNGRRLEGVKLVFGNDEKEEYTKRDLPLINILSWEEEEEPFKAGKQDIVEINGTITFALNISQKNPLIDWNADDRRNSAVYYLNRMRDVIETDYDGSIDLKLEDTCRTGISTTVSEAQIDGGAPHHIIEVEVLYAPHPYERGTRTDTVSLRDMGTSAD